jgi:hypothetical protein
MSKRAARRRLANHRRRPRPWEVRADPRNNSGEYGGVFGTLNDGKAWIVRFPTTGDAERFLSILGPPPATEERLQAALKLMGKGVRHA